MEAEVSWVLLSHKSLLHLLFVILVVKILIWSDWKHLIALWQRPFIPSQTPSRRHQDSETAPGVFSLRPPGGALWDFHHCTPCTEIASAAEEALGPVLHYHGDRRCNGIPAHLLTGKHSQHQKRGKNQISALWWTVWEPGWGRGAWSSLTIKMLLFCGPSLLSW